MTVLIALQDKDSAHETDEEGDVVTEKTHRKSLGIAKIPTNNIESNATSVHPAVRTSGGTRETIDPVNIVLSPSL